MGHRVWNMGGSDPAAGPNNATQGKRFNVAGLQNLPGRGCGAPVGDEAERRTAARRVRERQRALNETAGEWRIRALDAMSGKADECRFTIERFSFPELKISPDNLGGNRVHAACKRVVQNQFQ